MALRIAPGNAVGFSINAHRDLWNGAICRDPSAWNCGADIEFRQSKCDEGIANCYHLRAFDPVSPVVVADDNGIGWILSADPEALDDQVLLLWTRVGREPRGVREDVRPEEVVAGAYRVKSVEAHSTGYRTLWRVVPHTDGWVRFAPLDVRRPRYSQLAGPYVREVDHSQVLRVFDNVHQLRQSSPAEPSFDVKRFERFYGKLTEWLDIAGSRMQEVRARQAARESVRRSAPPPPKVALEAPSPAPAPAPGAVPLPTAGGDAVPVGVGARPLCVEPSRFEWITATYGEDVSQRLRVAAMTKPLVLFRGLPGVGKSYLALRLLDDPSRERTLVVPVGSTWRGREDLLGYVNPVSNVFEPTPFTRFLLAAEQAWNAGDKRPRNVVFEEFNLSQPEHWMSDVLALSQLDDPADRRIALGGIGVAERSGTVRDARSVYLSPALTFLGTLNSDFTTRSLSPRVLDRAALIDLRVPTKDVLARAGVELSAEESDALSDLDFHLRRRGASLSLRAARSLGHCLGQLVALDADRWRVIDLVLVQEVLSKVRLSSHLGGDHELMQDLKKWTHEYGKQLSLSSSVIADWEEALQGGLDVEQA